MKKSIKVLLIIAIVLCLVQLFDLLTEIIPFSPPSPPSFALNQDNTTLVNWMVFWPGGLLVLIAGVVLHQKYSLLRESLGIGGIYLMLLGNNGGIYASGHEVLRFATSILTLVILIIISIRSRYNDAT